MSREQVTTDPRIKQYPDVYTKRPYDYIGVQEMKNTRLVARQLIAEFLGTFLYLSLVLSAGISIQTLPMDMGSRTILVALANGTMVASIVAIIGHISGGHINPAVTVGSFVCKHIKLLKALCYIAVQIVGSIAGSAVAYAISSETIRGNLGAIIPYRNIRADQVFAIEFLATFVLVSVVLSVVDTTRGARGLGSSPLAIGLAIIAGITSCNAYTSSLNPVRSLGPAVIMNIWRHHWVYWVGPLAGGLAAGLVYRFLFMYHQHQTVVLSSSPSDIRRSVSK